jgi:flagellar biosynthesis protein FliP
MCAEVLLAIFGLYVFPIMGRFENNLKQTIKNGMLMPVKHYICTLWLIVIVTLVITFGVLFPPITLVLPGVMAFATSYPLFLVFKKYESDVTNPLENGILPNFEIRQLSSDQLKKFIKTPKNNEKDMSSKSGSKAKNKPKKEKKPKNNVF